MKFLLAAALALSLTSPVVYAAEDDMTEGLSTQLNQMSVLSRCVGHDMTIMNQHTQVAASLISTKSDSQLIESYKAMAKADHERIQSYTDAFKTVIVPQFIAHGVDEDEVVAKFDEGINRTMTQALIILSRQRPLNDQVALQQQMTELSQACVTFAHKLNGKSL